jgi:hypothetical protein
VHGCSEKKTLQNGASRLPRADPSAQEWPALRKNTHLPAPLITLIFDIMLELNRRQLNTLEMATDQAWSVNCDVLLRD